jgi:glucose-1-phosphate adenylyltransferase
VFAHSFHDSCVNMANGVPYWRDVGTVDAYWEANIDLVRVTPELDLYDESWPIWTHQVQAPPAKFVFDDDDRRGMAVDSMVAGGCVVSGAAVRRSVLFSHVCVHEHAVIEDSVVLPHVKVGEGVVLRQAVIDKHCRIPSGMKIGVDPEIDRRRFYVTPRGITLVTAEMLGQASSHVPRLVHHAKSYGVSRTA